MTGIGARIRDVRTTQQKSLNDVASRAKISAATLSRIETEKQGVGITLFLLIAKVLKVSPHELLGEPEPREEGDDPLAAKVASMKPNERTRLWNDLAEARREERTRRRTTAAPSPSAHIEELLAQIDYLRQEVESMRSRAGTRARSR